MSLVTCNACGMVVVSDAGEVIARQDENGVWRCEHSPLAPDGHIPVEDMRRCGWG